MTYEFNFWYKESLKTSPGEETPFSNLYENYKDKCIAKGFVPIGRRIFANSLKKEIDPLLKQEKVRRVNNKGIKYQGLTLKDKEQES